MSKNGLIVEVQSSILLDKSPQATQGEKKKEESVLSQGMFTLCSTVQECVQTVNLCTQCSDWL